MVSIRDRFSRDQTALSISIKSDPVLASLLFNLYLMIWSHFWMNRKFFQHRKEIFSYMPLSRYRRRTGCSLGRQPYLVRVRTRGAECWGRYTLEPLSLASCLDLLLAVWPWTSCVMTSASVFSCIQGTDWHFPPHRLVVTRNGVNIYEVLRKKGSAS